MPIRTTLTRLIVLTMLAFIPAAALAQSSRADIDKSIDDNVGDHVKFQQFMATLQQAVAKHDAAGVAALVSYPITVNPGKNSLVLRTPQAFIASYDKVVTPPIASVIEQQKYENLFVNYQGAMFGNGELWIAGICKDKACIHSDIKIRTIQNTAGK